MDSGLVRLLIVAALFLLLAGDYGFLLDQLTGVFGPEDATAAEDDAAAVKAAEQDTAELAFKETGSIYRYLKENESVIIIYAVRATRRKPATLLVESECSCTCPRGRSAKAQLLATMKNSCLPKLICELNAQPQKDKLTDSEKALLSLISDTTISTTAEVTSRYHFAAHMGQLISGVDGAGCHNFYPSCPFPGMQVLNMIKAIRLRPPS